MPVRIKITLLFTLLVAFILTIVVAAVYYFSYSLRIDIINTRLTNRAISIGRLLSQTDIFSNRLVQQIDSSTSKGYVSETMQAYDYKNRKVYDFSRHPEDSKAITNKLLNDARVEGSVFFSIGSRDAVAYHYVGKDARLVMIAAGEDMDGKRNLQGLTNILVLSYLGGLVIAYLGGYFFSKTLLKPIRKIADVVHLVTAQNLTQRLKTSEADDEWHYLAVTINELLNRLQDSFDIQRRFISNASHELSTPLTSISNQLEVSLLKERTAEDYRKVMASVHQDVLHMAHLTRSLLELAKASGNPGGIEISTVRIDEVLFRIPAEITKVNKGGSVSIEFDELPAHEDDLLILGNEELLLTAIKNIAANACKYAPDNHALIKLMVGSEVAISIIDKGPGIPSPELERIFQPFQRANASTNKEGFGLGLSLASRIIKMHKGRIEVSSVMNEGSTFTVYLPVAKR